MIDFEKLPPDQQEVAELIAKEARRQGVDPSLALAIAGAETRGSYKHFADKDKVLTSPKGAVGVMQIMPNTAELYNKRDKVDIDPYDLKSNVRGGVHIIKDLLTTYKDPLRAVIAYNGGPKAVTRYNEKEDLTALPSETFGYVDYIHKEHPLDQGTGFLAADEHTPVADQMTKEGTQTTTTTESPAEETVDPFKAALAGAAANVAGPAITDYKVPPAANTAAAQDALRKAEIRLQVAQNRMAQAAQFTGHPGGPTLADLEAEYRMAQVNQQVAEKELAAARSAAASKVAPTPSPAPAAPATGLSGATPTVATGEASLIPSGDQHARGLQGTTKETGITGRASQTTYNERTAQIARNAANQEKVMADLARQGLIDPNKAYALTEGISGSTPSGVKVAPDLAGEVSHKAEIEQRMADTKAQQERLAQQQEIERAKASHKQASVQTSEAKRKLREVERAKQSGVARATSQVQRAEDAAQAARQIAAEAKAAPAGTNRAMQVLGVKTANLNPVLRTGAGALAGAGVAMSVNEALERYHAGDYRGMVLPTLEAAFGSLAMVPPIGPIGAAARGIGTVGSLGLGAYEMAGRPGYEKVVPQQEKAVGGVIKKPLTLKRRGGLSSL